MGPLTQLNHDNIELQPAIYSTANFETFLPPAYQFCANEYDTNIDM